MYDSIFVPLCVVVLYSICIHTFEKFVSRRERIPSVPRAIIAVYNMIVASACFITSCGMTMAVLDSYKTGGLYGMVCGTCHPRSRVGVDYWMMVYYIICYLRLLDTAVLYSKKNHPSVLHSMTHTNILFFMDMVMTDHYFMWWIPIITGTAFDTILYLYYTLTSLCPACSDWRYMKRIRYLQFIHCILSCIPSVVFPVFYTLTNNCMGSLRVWACGTVLSISTIAVLRYNYYKRYIELHRVFIPHDSTCTKLSRPSIENIGLYV